MNKFKELRKSQKITQLELSNILSVKQSTISKWENGSSFPDYQTLKNLSKYFKVSIDYLLDDEQNKNSTMKIAVIGVIPAGIPIQAVENIIGYEEIAYSLGRTGNFFALKVRGDSMSPQIEEDDILIIKQQESAENGDICVVLVGNDATVKRIKKEPNGLWLIPNNPTYNTMFFNNDEIENSPVKILGKAVEIRRHI